MQPVSRDLSSAMNDINALLNQIPSLHQEIHGHGHFDPSSSSSHDDFFEQMLSSVPSAASSFPWADDQPPPPPPLPSSGAMLGQLMEEQSAAVLASKLRQHQISNGAAKALMLQQQLLLARGLRSPSGGDGNGHGLLPMAHVDHNDVVVGGSSSSFKNSNSGNDASMKALFNGFTGSLGQTSNQPPQFNQGGAMQQTPNFGGASAGPATNQPAASGSSGGGAAGQPRQRVRARRGQATDPHSIAERLRRERIAERMKALQELVPNANKTDKASMLDEIIDYVKFLQLQVKVLSMSRLGGAAAVAPLVADISSEGRNGNGTQTASTSNNYEGLTVTEQQVAKLMEEDMGSAMQYLQGKGLCLMPISLATAISTATCQPRNPLNANGTTAIHQPLLNNGETGGSPTSTTLSVLTVQSTAINANGAEYSVKEANSISKQ